MSDDSLYQCQVGGSMQVDPIVSNTVRLTVYVETTKPQILQGEEVEVVEGREEELQCMAEGRPRPEVQVLFHHTVMASHHFTTVFRQKNRF